MGFFLTLMCLISSKKLFFDSIYFISSYLIQQSSQTSCFENSVTVHTIYFCFFFCHDSNINLTRLISDVSICSWSNLFSISTVRNNPRAGTQSFTPKSSQHPHFIHQNIYLYSSSRADLFGFRYFRVFYV